MKVVFVVGPTASGKSQLAFELAKELKGAIINCDSIQLYQKLNIGSAMPSLQERSEVPHYLYDQIPPGQELTVGDYYRLFFATLEEIKAKYPVVFVVGGTGFYFQAIEKGLFEIGASDPQIIKQVENELEKNGPDVLYAELQTKDPASAKKISINDHYRLCRAIEIIRTHNKTKSEVEAEFQQNQKLFPFPLLKIGVLARREVLEPLVQKRTKTMLEQGLLDEVKGLIALGFRQWAPLASIGYHECVQFLEEQIADIESLKAEIEKSTLRLGKKQRTWFSRDKEIHWYTREQFADAKQLIKKFVQS